MGLILTFPPILSAHYGSIFLGKENGVLLGFCVGIPCVAFACWKLFFTIRNTKPKDHDDVQHFPGPAGPVHGRGQACEQGFQVVLLVIDRDDDADVGFCHSVILQDNDQSLFSHEDTKAQRGICLFLDRLTLCLCGFV